MLDSNQRGFATMSRDLSGCSIESTDIETCKKYCTNGDVVVERIPYTCGFSIRIMWYKWWKIINFKDAPYNILWLHFSFQKEKLHKCGKVVYDSAK